MTRQILDDSEDDSDDPTDTSVQRVEDDNLMTVVDEPCSSETPPTAEIAQIGHDSGDFNTAKRVVFLNS